MDSWRKLGLVLAPNPGLWWSQTYASVPSPIIVNDQLVRVYYSSRCKDNKSRVSFADFDINNPQHLVYRHDDICLDVGAPGTFDSDGVQATQIVRTGGWYVMLYTGYQQLKDGYYLLFAGDARSSNGKVFEKSSNIPLLDRTEKESFVRVGATIHSPSPNYKINIFYIACDEWRILDSGKKTPVYKMMIGEGESIHDFDKLQHFKCIMTPDVSKSEIGFSRPWPNQDQLYYAVRKIEADNNPYTHIEVADFKDGKVTRNGQISLTRSEGENMVCFPAVLDLPGGKYMWYNSSNYGAEGIHLAKYDA